MPNDTRTPGIIQLVGAADSSLRHARITSVLVTRSTSQKGRLVVIRLRLLEPGNPKGVVDFAFISHRNPAVKARGRHRLGALRAAAAVLPSQPLSILESRIVRIWTRWIKNHESKGRFSVIQYAAPDPAFVRALRARVVPGAADSRPPTRAIALLHRPEKHPPASTKQRRKYVKR
jgi:hypothetical protein